VSELALAEITAFMPPEARNGIRLKIDFPLGNLALEYLLGTDSLDGWEALQRARGQLAFERAAGQYHRPYPEQEHVAADRAAWDSWRSENQATIRRRHLLLENFASFAPEINDYLTGAKVAEEVGRGGRCVAIALHTQPDGRRFIAKIPRSKTDKTNIKELRGFVEDYAANLCHGRPGFESIEAISYLGPVVISERALGERTEILPEEIVDTITEQDVHQAVNDLMRGAKNGILLDRVGSRNCYFNADREPADDHPFTFLDYYQRGGDSGRVAYHNLAKFAQILTYIGSGMEEAGLGVAPLYTAEQKARRLGLLIALKSEANRLSSHNPTIPVGVDRYIHFLSR
jgi:hypothetical protein